MAAPISLDSPPAAGATRATPGPASTSIVLAPSPRVRYLLRIADTCLIHAQRLAARVKAWDDGAWVREAALAHARKQTVKEQAA